MNRKRLVMLGLLSIALPIVLVACETPVNQGLEITSLEITPLKATPGERATVKVEVSNTADSERTYTMPLAVNGVAEDRTSFTLASGATKTIEFSLVRTEIKNYRVTVGNRELIFEVYQPPPPVFKLSDLKVNPAQVDIGKEVLITVKIANIGGSKGSYTAELKINGSIEKTYTQTIAAADEATLGFFVSRNTPGTYSVALADLTGEFMVTEPVVPIQIPPPVVCPPTQTYDKTSKC